MWPPNIAILLVCSMQAPVALRGISSLLRPAHLPIHRDCSGRVWAVTCISHLESNAVALQSAAAVSQGLSQELPNHTGKLAGLRTFDGWLQKTSIHRPKHNTIRHMACCSSFCAVSVAPCRLIVVSFLSSLPTSVAWGDLHVGRFKLQVDHL